MGSSHLPFAPPSENSLKVGQRLTSTSAIPPGHLVEVIGCRPGVHSIVHAIWKLPYQATSPEGNNAGATGTDDSRASEETPSHLLDKTCLVCQDPIWSSDAARVVFVITDQTPPPRVVQWSPVQRLRGLLRLGSSTATAKPPNTSAKPLFCICFDCMKRWFELASKDKSMLPVSIGNIVIDQLLADTLLEDQPEMLRAFW
eukprot:jgi/Botrbrau1/8241/Bobra.0392s0036.1